MGVPCPCDVEILQSATIIYSLQKENVMKAWRLDSVPGELKRVEVDIPQPNPGTVIVETKAVGLCHTDVGYMEGKIPFAKPLPIILGHEAAGVVSAIGEGVENVAVGDAVAAALIIADAPGATRDGAYADFFEVTAAQLVHLPAGFDWGQAAAATDAGVTAYTGVAVHGAVKAGDRVGIVGLGGLGMTGARIAKVLGATVFGVEPRQSSWEVAKEQGVDEVYADVSELEGKDLDVIIDFAGFGTTTAGALRAVKYAGTVVLVGLGKTETEFTSFDLVSRSITLKGSTPDGNPENLRAVLKMIADGDLKIRATEIGFEEIPDGLGRLQRGEADGRLYATI